MSRLVAEKLIERLDIIVGVAPLPSTEIAEWLGNNLKGGVMSAKIIKRLRQSTTPEQEGIAICAEFLHEAAQIPGVSGANLTSLGNPDAVVDAINQSGIRNRQS